MIVFLLFILTVCSFLFYGVVGADKTWLEGPALILNFLLVTAWMVRKALGVGRQAVGEKQRSEIRSPISGGLWIFFSIYGVAMIPQAAVPFESKLAILMIGGVVGAYFVWGGELRAFKESRTVLGWLIFVVMLAALYGLVVHFKSPDQVLWTERYAVYEGRLMSTYICPNHFAHLMQMLLPFCLVLLFIPQTGLYLKILSAYSFLVFLPPLFLTESRAGWLGSLAAVGVTVCLMALRRSKKLFASLVILVPLCSTLILLGAWHSSETFQRRMQPVVTFVEGQAEEGVGSEARDFRPQTWMDTIDMIKEAPLLGHGPGNYRYTFPEYRKRFKGRRIVTGHPHNEYLELIADYGLIGFGLFALAWLYGCVWVLVKSLKAKETHHAYLGFAFLGVAAGTMVHSFFDFQMHIYPNALVFALLAAVAVGPLAAKRAKRGGKKHEARGTSGGRRTTLRSSLSEFGSYESAQSSQEVLGSRHKARGNKENELSTVGCERSAEFASCVSLCPLWLNKSAAWLLVVGFLVATAFCVQTMSSAYIRALGDKTAKNKQGAKHQARGTREGMGTGHSIFGSKPSAEGFYRLAIKIDPQNWRAFKGMAELLQDERYYSIGLAEKRELARTEREWWEKAYLHNPKDPEIVSGFGKSLISQGKVRGIGRLALGAGERPTANSLELGSQQIEQGLDLLRDACSYRNFNDTYWWTLGVELRKAGQYEEALEVFLYAKKLKNTPSIRKNIAWLKVKLKASGDRR